MESYLNGAGDARVAAAPHRLRPGYPPQIDAWLRDELRLRARKTVVDLGAGSGLFTHLLAETGTRVVAIEPDADLRANIARRDAHVRVIEGRAEALPLAPRSVDALVCAHSFHRFATPGALAEIRRVLKIGGRLGLIWNFRNGATPFVAALEALISAFAGEASRPASQDWRRLFPAPGFSPLSETAFDHLDDGPPESVVVAPILAMRAVAALDEAERERVAGLARDILARHGMVGLRVAVPYRTLAYACERIS